MLDALIFVADVVARKRCAMSLAFDIVKRMRSDALPLSSTLAIYQAHSYVLSVPSLTSVPCASGGMATKL